MISDDYPDRQKRLRFNVGIIPIEYRIGITDSFPRYP